MKLQVTAMLSITLATSAFAYSQQSSTQDANKGTTSLTQSADTNAPSSGTFVIPDTDMTLVYPADFRVEDPVNISHRSYRGTFGNPAENGHGGCHPILLELGAGDPETRAQNANAKHFVVEPPTGGIVLQEILPPCLDTSASEDDKLGSLAGGPRSMDGFIPFASMVSYQLCDYTTFFSAVGASSKDADGIRRESAGRTFIGTVAMGYKGRFFLWMITANDPQIFNELLHVHLQFAKDPPVALVPFELGQNDGKKKQVVPR